MNRLIPIPGAVRGVLPDGRRRHFHHGPIDLVVEAFGAVDEVDLAYDQAWARFESILGGLVAELPALRSPMPDRPNVTGSTAQRMTAACAIHPNRFVTPMAAVAGAVADEILSFLLKGRDLNRAYVNNGGDMAIHLAAGERFRTGLVTLAETPEAGDIATLRADAGIGGIATSGWRGRSLSLGIADSVTVLAHSAAAADVAATLIANAVDVHSGSIFRTPAQELDPDSDLGDRLVTIEVGALSPDEVQQALDAGVATAQEMLERQLVAAVTLTLSDEVRVVGNATPFSQPNDRREAACVT